MFVWERRHDEFGGVFTLLRIQNITSFFFFFFTSFGLVVVRLVTFFFSLGFLITTSSFIYPRLSASSSLSALKETLKYQHKAHTHTLGFGAFVMGFVWGERLEREGDWAEEEVGEEKGC